MGIRQSFQPIAVIFFRRIQSRESVVHTSGDAWTTARSHDQACTWAQRPSRNVTGSFWILALLLIVRFKLGSHVSAGYLDFPPLYEE